MTRLLPLALVLMLAACSAATAPPEETSTPDADTPAPTVNCEKAPQAFVAAIQEGITKKGAELTKASVVPAGEIVGGPPIAMSDKFADAVLVAGTISGGGVLDEPAVWIVERNDPNDSGLIFAVSAAAKRYSDWGADVTDAILADGTTDALACANG